MSHTPLDARLSPSIFGAPSFSLANRVRRAIWQILWMILASWTPPPMHAWRRFLLRSCGAKIASTARIYGTADIWYPPNLTMEAYSVLSGGVTCYCQAPITLEEFVTVSQRAHLCAGTHEIDDPAFQLVARPIRIERHAWVASEAFVGPGVTVGQGAVLGARGVAFKNLDEWTVYVGNPAMPIRKRKNISAEVEAIRTAGVGASHAGR